MDSTRPCEDAMRFKQNENNKMKTSYFRLETEFCPSIVQEIEFHISRSADELEVTLFRSVWHVGVGLHNPRVVVDHKDGQLYTEVVEVLFGV